MGAGLLARIDISRSPSVEESSTEERQVRGCLDAWVRYDTSKTEDSEQVFWGVRIDHRHVTTHRAETTGYALLIIPTRRNLDRPGVKAT